MSRGAIPVSVGGNKFCLTLSRVRGGLERETRRFIGRTTASEQQTIH